MESRRNILRVIDREPIQRDLRRRSVWLTIGLMLASLDLVVAQGPPPQEVIFHVQFLQLTRASAGAIAAQRAVAGGEFEDAGGILLHPFRENAALDTLLASQVALGGAEVITVPKLRTRAGEPALLLIGGHYPIPTLPDGNPAGAPAPSPEFGSRDFGIRLSFRPEQLRKARFMLLEEGVSPGTAYFLCQKE